MGIRRVLATVTGGLLGLVAVGLSVLGVVALNATHHDGGFVPLGHATFGADGYAVVSEPYDWGVARYAVKFGTVRVRVTPDNGAGAMFVGLARPDDVRRYLDGVGYATAHPAGTYQVAYTRHDGTAPSTAPGRAGVWTAQASGSGTLTLRFAASAQPGDRVLVAMNADGSRSVGGRVETAATIPALGRIAVVALVAAVVLLTMSAILIFRSLRARVNA